ncbi:MAG: tetratricopeptide repeat protein [Pseudomonadota bacterium]
MNCARLALLLAPLLLAACSSTTLDTAKAPPTRLTLDDRWLEIQSMRETYGRWSGTFFDDGYYANASGANPAVNCPYRATPDPKSSRLWFWDIFFPVFLENRLFVNCDNGTKRKIIAQYKEGGKTLARRWYVLARQPTDAEELQAFMPVAERYRAAPYAAGTSEAVRPFKVAAEAAVREKRWRDAILEYRKALAVDPAWPQAHFNLALIYGELGIQEAAVLEMQKYLLLVPDAENARTAQDKIYEWKARAPKRG